MTWQGSSKKEFSGSRPSGQKDPDRRVSGLVPDRSGPVSSARGGIGDSGGRDRDRTPSRSTVTTQEWTNVRHPHFSPTGGPRVVGGEPVSGLDPGTRLPSPSRVGVCRAGTVGDSTPVLFVPHSTLLFPHLPSRPVLWSSLNASLLPVSHQGRSSSLTESLCGTRGDRTPSGASPRGRTGRVSPGTLA